MKKPTHPHHPHHRHRRRRMAVRKASSALCFAILGASASPARANENVANPQSRQAPLDIIAGTAKSVQKGIASWYGRAFHGRPTASGERFDMHALSAAHPTLPLFSYVRVRNSENNREVVVRINDRGPFHGGRIIDLSYAAAQQLDVRGLGKVVLELITGSELQAIRNGRPIHSASKAVAESTPRVAVAPVVPLVREVPAVGREAEESKAASTVEASGAIMVAAAAAVD